MLSNAPESEASPGSNYPLAFFIDPYSPKYGFHMQKYMFYSKQSGMIHWWPREIASGGRLTAWVVRTHQVAVREDGRPARGFSIRFEVLEDHHARDLTVVSNLRKSGINLFQ